MSSAALSEAVEVSIKNQNKREKCIVECNVVFMFPLFLKVIDMSSKPVFLS